MSMAFPYTVGALLISVAISALIGLHVARGIHKAGAERYAGRILILAAITNTAIVALMLLLLSAMTLRGVVTPVGFRVMDLAVVLLLLLVPVRATWNYVKAPARIMRRFGLTPVGIDDYPLDVFAVAALMEIPAPRILSSPRCRTPFVFGRNSRQVQLAVPDTWSDVDASSRYIMLCHELAHIRNRLLTGLQDREHRRVHT